MKIFIGERMSCNLNYQDIYLTNELASKFDITQDASQADILVFPSSCSCTEDQINYSLNYIDYYVSKKKPTAKVYLTGCLTRKLKYKEQQEYLDDFFAQNIDAVIPQNEPDALLKEISEEFSASNETMGFCELYEERKIAKIYIGNGCENNCAFCKVSYQDYPVKSGDLEKIKATIDEVTNRGVTTLDLIATNICQYGLDLYKEPKLPELISYIEKKNVEKLNLLGVAYKDAIQFDFAEPFSKSSKLSYISGSLESGSPKLLKMIRKGFTPEQIIEFIKSIKKFYPKEIDTNIISGLPTENIDDVKETLKVLEEIAPSSVNVSEYVSSSLLEHLNRFPQLSDEEIRKHTDIYQRELTKKRVLGKLLYK